MFWPFLAAGPCVSLALVKLSALLVWVAVLTKAFMLAVASFIGAVVYSIWALLRRSIKLIGELEQGVSSPKPSCLDKRRS
jgi:hypothetical protein